MGLFGSSRPPPHSEVRSKSYRVFRPRQWASLERGAGCPHWVKLRRTQSEHMFSALPPNSDIARHSRHVSNVPTTEVSNLIRSLDLLAIRRILGPLSQALWQF